MNWPAVIAVLALQGLVVGAVIGWDRWREPRRDPRRPVGVADRRTCRYALARVGRLDLTDDRDRMTAVGHLTAARTWLRYELRTGPRRRRLWCAVQLRTVEIKLSELRAPAGLYS
ncbi:hypothetical protein ACIBTV_27645 [Micromonospora sp. NPDC049366]|uniref:hypothetical protein n=1 Tax=Micromonospora sp. NPDC049366 TaxID=3364271 RepID=UPI0037BBC968